MTTTPFELHCFRLCKRNDDLNLIVKTIHTVHKFLIVDLTLVQ